MKLYENVVIGNYLYGLGFAVGARVQRRGQDFPSVVSLLQQTPDDQAIGDALIMAPGVMRILEFKREENKDSKEENRHTRLSQILDRSPKRMKEVSVEVHWYIETKPLDSYFHDRVVPYLNAFPRPVQFEPGNEFGQFVEQTADAMVERQASYTAEEAADYLAILVAAHKTGAIGSGAVVVKLEPNGAIHYAELASVLDLVIERKLLLEKYSKQEQARVEVLERQKSRDIDREP